MNLLIVSHNIPFPPNKGEKIRSFHMIEELAKEHNIFLVCFCRNLKDLEHLETLQSIYKSVTLIPLKPLASKFYAFLALLSRKPLTLGFFFSRKMKKQITSLIAENKIDISLAISSSSSQYILKLNKPLKATDFIDIDSQKWFEYSKISTFPKSWIFYRESILLADWEKKVAENSELSLVTTSREKKLLELASPSSAEKIMVVNCGVDTEFFHPKEFNNEKNALVFTGQMDYLPNIDAVIFFYINILPLIRSELPHTDFFIVGRNPDPQLEEICRTATITGEVDDIRPWLQKADVFVAPMRLAFGIQNKVLEAMACGVPVVTTSRTLQGMKLQSGREIIAADTPAAFAEGVTSLLESKDFRNSIAGSGLDYVKENHDCRTVSKDLNRKLKAMAEVRP